MAGALLVTGAASVAGRALLERLREDEEWKEIPFVLTARDAVRLPAAAARLEADFSRPGEADRLADAILPWAPLAGAVLAAGASHDAPLVRLDEKTWDRIWRINAGAHAALLIRLLDASAFLPGAPVVLVSSVVGFRGNAGQAAYAAAKGAMLEIAGLCARRGLRANLLLPPLMESPLLAALSPEARRRLFAQRLLPDPDPPRTFAEAAAFLLSKRSSYINNAIFHADSRVGGWL